MPQIPSFVPRVRAEVPQSPGFSAPSVTPMRDATGGQMAALGEGLQAAGITADKIGDWIDEVQAQTTFNLFNEELTKIESSFGQLQGKDAMDAYQKTTESVVSARKKFEGSLQNDRQRQMFASRANVRQGDSTTQLSAWGAKQTKIAKVGSLEAASAGSLRNYQNTLAFARGIPDEDARASQEATARSWLDLSLKQREEAMRLVGGTDEQVAGMRATTLNDAHGDVIAQLLKAKDTSGAEAYFKKNQGEMTGSARQEAATQIGMSGDRDKAWKLATDTALPSKLSDRLSTINELRTSGSINDAVWREATSYALTLDQQRREGENQDKLDALRTVDSIYAENPSAELDVALVSRLKTLGILDDAYARRDNAKSTEAGRAKLYELMQNTAVIRGMSWNEVSLTYGKYLGRHDREVVLHDIFKSENGDGKGDGGDKVFSNEEKNMRLYREWAGDSALVTRDPSKPPVPANWLDFDNFKAMWSRQLAQAKVGDKELSFDEQRKLLARLKLENEGRRGTEDANLLNLTPEQALSFRLPSPYGARGATVGSLVSKPEAFNVYAPDASMYSAETKRIVQSYSRSVAEGFGVKFNARGQVDYAQTPVTALLKAVDARTVESDRQKAEVTSQRDRQELRIREAETARLAWRDETIKELLRLDVPPSAKAWEFVSSERAALMQEGETPAATVNRLLQAEGYATIGAPGGVDPARWAELMRMLNDASAATKKR